MLFTTRSKKYMKENTRGFTLVEALVSLGIFSIVVVAASGVILSIISSNKKNQAISSVVNNLNYSIESMVRDIKTGYKYQCDVDSIPATDIQLDNFKLLANSCLQGAVPTVTQKIMLISTITGKEQVVKYEKSGTGADVFINKTVYTEDSSGNVTSVSYPLTDKNNITISQLEFSVRTPPPLIPRSINGDPTGQPSVFLTVKGTARVNQINISDFFIQTYISQRLPNFI